jgi:flagellar protein FliJ
MKKFRFSLATLLEVRRQKEIVERKNLLEAHLVLQKAITGLNELENQRLEFLDILRQKQMPVVEMRELTEYFDYLEVIKKRIVLQQEIINDALESIENQRKVVVVAMQKRKIIENLREKKFAEWEYEAQSQEKAFFDELTTIRHTYSGRENLRGK